MPTNLVITLTPPVFVDGYCPTSAQQLANDIAAGMGAQIPGNYTVWNFGDTEPSVEDQDKPWLRQNADGSPDRVYIYYNGQWVSPHPTPPADGERRMFAGTEAEVWAYDGGDSTDPATNEPAYAGGAMWEVDHDFDGRLPIGPGTPDGWGTAIGEGTNAGTSKVQLTAALLPAHQHYVAHSAQANGTGNLLTAAHSIAYRGGALGEENYALLGSTAVTNAANVGITSSVGDANDTTNKLPTLPPVRAVWFIKRTARIAYLPT